MMQALLEELAQGSFNYNLEFNQENHLTNFIFVHPSFVTLTRTYLSVCH